MGPRNLHGGRRSPRGLARRTAGPPADRSIRSRQSLWSTYSVGSVASVASAWSIASAGSILSIGSAGSALSIGSAGSVLSIGSAGSALSIGGAGSALSVGARTPPRCSATGSEGSDPTGAVRLAQMLATAALVTTALAEAARLGPRRVPA